MSSPTYGGLLIPKPFLVKLLKRALKKEVIDGVALQFTDRSTVDLKLWTAIKDENGSITRVEEHQIPNKIPALGTGIPFQKGKRVRDCVFFKSDSTLAEQEKGDASMPFGFSYFTLPTIEAVLDNTATDFLLVTGGHVTDLTSGRDVFSFSISGFPTVNQTPEIRSAGTVDGEPLFYNGIPCPPYWVGFKDAQDIGLENTGGPDLLEIEKHRQIHELILGD